MLLCSASKSQIGDTKGAGSTNTWVQRRRQTSERPPQSKLPGQLKPDDRHYRCYRCYRCWNTMFSLALYFNPFEPPPSARTDIFGAQLKHVVQDHLRSRRLQAPSISHQVEIHSCLV